MQKLAIVGGGFAGVWAALGAARMRDQLGGTSSDLDIQLVSRDPWLTIRPRLYEASLDGVRVPLDSVTRPIGVHRIEGEVRKIDADLRTITLQGADGPHVLEYGRMILAAGSRVQYPPVPGAEHAFFVDTYAESLTLHRHVAALAGRAGPGTDREGSFTATVVGAGFTGIEVATELVTMLRRAAAAAGYSGDVRVLLVEAGPTLAPDLGAAARSHVEQALLALGIEWRVGHAVLAIESGGVRLGGGEWIPSATTVWAGGFRASRLAEHLGVTRDSQGRLPVDAFLRVLGVEGIFAAGDVARAMADDEHVAPMSCQLASPMGEQAGANAVAELLGAPLARFSRPNYVTCLDLGDAGALFMQGWGREVKLTGFWAKVMKQAINGHLIYPPREQSVPCNGADLDVRPAA